MEKQWKTINEKSALYQALTQSEKVATWIKNLSAKNFAYCIGEAFDGYEEEVITENKPFLEQLYKHTNNKTTDQTNLPCSFAEYQSEAFKEWWIDKLPEQIQTLEESSSSEDYYNEQTL